METVLTYPKYFAGSYGTAAPQDHEFVHLLRAYRPSGGLARAEDIVARRAARGSSSADDPQGISDAICFEWNGTLWLPWFQFEPASLSIRPGPARVIGELAPVFDGWAMASWFAATSVWLGGARPIDMLGDINAVLGAARADRFIAAG